MMIHKEGEERNEEKEEQTWLEFKWKGEGGKI